jgi:hypothetical protein
MLEMNVYARILRGLRALRGTRRAFKIISQESILWLTLFFIFDILIVWLNYRGDTMKVDSKKNEDEVEFCHRRRYIATDRLAVEQGEAYGFIISWNPDDNRFYLHAKDKDQTVLSTMKEFKNIVQKARKLSLKK